MSYCRAPEIMTLQCRHRFYVTRQQKQRSYFVNCCFLILSKCSLIQISDQLITWRYLVHNKWNLEADVLQQQKTTHTPVN